MSVISITDFKGMAPKYGADQLPKGYTVTASDVELDTGAAVPGYGIDVETDLGTAGIQSIFKVNGKWLSSTQDLDYCRSIQPGDDKHTVYFCGKTQPLHYTDDDLVGSVGLLPESSKALSIPVPTSQITIENNLTRAVRVGASHYSSAINDENPVADVIYWDLVLPYVSDEFDINSIEYIKFNRSPDFNFPLYVHSIVGRMHDVANEPNGLKVMGILSYAPGNVNYKESGGNNLDTYLADLPAPSLLTVDYVWHSTKADESKVSYCFTLVVDGRESPPGDVLDTMVHEGNHPILRPHTTIVDAAESIRYYRDSGEGFLFIGEVEYGVTAGGPPLTDASISAGAALSSQLNDPPISGMHSLIALPNNVLAGAYKNQLCFSRPGLPHAWPALWQVPVDGEIVGLGHFQNTVVVLTDQNAWMVNAYDPANASPEATNIGFGCVSKHGIVSHTDGVYYPSKKGLHRVYPGMARDDLVTKDIFDTLSWLYLYPEQFHAAIIDDKYKAVTDTQIINIYLTRQFYTISSALPSGELLEHPATGGLAINNLSPSVGDVVTLSNNIADIDGLNNPYERILGESAPGSGTYNVDLMHGSMSTYLVTEASEGLRFLYQFEYDEDDGDHRVVQSAPTNPVAVVPNFAPEVTINSADKLTDPLRVEIDYTVIDPEGDTVTVVIEQSCDGGAWTEIMPSTPYSTDTTGGDGNGGATTAKDYINIVSVTPASAPIGVPTEFTVVVDYDLKTTTQAVVNLGFNDGNTIYHSALSYVFISEEHIVGIGAGQLTFIVTKTPVDSWLKFPIAGQFGVNATLSPEPHPSSWSPLAAEIVPIT